MDESKNSEKIEIDLKFEKKTNFIDIDRVPALVREFGRMKIKESIEAIRSSGFNQQFSPIEIVTTEEYKAIFPNDDWLGLGSLPSAKYRIEDKKIFIREEFMGEPAIHELFHSIFDNTEEKIDSICSGIREGIVQSAAEYVAKQNLMVIKPTYKAQVSYVREMILPFVGLPEFQFYQGYADADDKSKFIADLIISANKEKFDDSITGVHRWGDHPALGIAEDLQKTPTFENLETPYCTNLWYLAGKIT